MPELAPSCIARRVQKSVTSGVDPLRFLPPLGAALGRPIVLVGLMGVGKSTIGRRLAQRLGLEFVDSDDAIADAAGAPAGEVFERFGEESFRDGERRLVARLLDGSVRIIATGGGAYVDPDTRQLLNRRAITVWLDAPVDVLAHRTARRTTRPLLNKGNPRQTLARLAAERSALYAQAHVHVRSSTGAHGEVVDAILSGLRLHLSVAGDPPPG